MSEESIKKGIDIVNQFFDCMEKLKSEVVYFEEECRAAIMQKEAFFRVYGLSFNLAWTLRRVICRLEEYDGVLRNTLLYDYFNENRRYVEDVFGFANKLDEFISTSLATYSMDLLDDDWVGIDLDDEDETSKLLIEDNDYLEKLSTDISSNSDKIYRIIIFYIRYIHKQLIEVRNIRLNRTENDYKLLFEQEFKGFLTTDNWNDLRDGFIETTITIKFRGVEPTVEQLQKMRGEEFTLMQELRKELGSFDAYLNDYSKLAKHIVNQEIKHNAKNPIIDLFTCFGRITLIDKWIDDLNEECPLMKPISDAAPLKKIVFTKKLSEERLKNLWPKIEEIYDNHKAIDWVCFYHVLLYRNYILCDDFKYFARWINTTAGREILSEGNIRQIKTSYWAKEAHRTWTIEGFHEWRNTTKGDNTYKDYELLCEAIDEMIKQG